MSATRRLKKARKTRHQISTEMKLLERGHSTVYDLLETPPQAVKSVAIYTFLRRTPKLGPDGAKKILMTLHIWPEDRIGALSLAQRRSILEALPHRVEKYYGRVK